MIVRNNNSKKLSELVRYLEHSLKLSPEFVSDSRISIFIKDFRMLGSIDEYVDSICAKIFDIGLATEISVSNSYFNVCAEKEWHLEFFLYRKVNQPVEVKEE